MEEHDGPPARAASTLRALFEKAAIVSLCACDVVGRPNGGQRQPAGVDHRRQTGVREREDLGHGRCDPVHVPPPLACPVYARRQRRPYRQLRRAGS